MRVWYTTCRGWCSSKCWRHLHIHSDGRYDITLLHKVETQYTIISLFPFSLSLKDMQRGVLLCSFQSLRVLFQWRRFSISTTHTLVWCLVSIMSMQCENTLSGAKVLSHRDWKKQMKHTADDSLCGVHNMKKCTPYWTYLTLSRQTTHTRVKKDARAWYNCIYTRLLSRTHLVTRGCYHVIGVTSGTCNIAPFVTHKRAGAISVEMCSKRVTQLMIEDKSQNTHRQKTCTRSVMFFTH